MTEYWGKSRVFYITGFQHAFIWLQQSVTREWFTKIVAALFAGFLVQLHDAVEVLRAPVALAWLFWALDFAAGVARVIADPDTDPCPEKATYGVAKGFVIPVAAITAWGIEKAIYLVFTWDPDGMFVIWICLGMVVEEAFSIKRHTAFFYSRIDRIFDRAITMVRGGETDEEDDE